MLGVLFVNDVLMMFVDVIVCVGGFMFGVDQSDVMIVCDGMFVCIDLVCLIECYCDLLCIVLCSGDLLCVGV